MKEWGFLRETAQKAIEAGKDLDTGVCRTGLDEYLDVIFPETHDWVHDKSIKDVPKEKQSKRRPDYRSPSLKLIVEFDGLQHYTNPEKIKADAEAIEYYTSLGYKVVRIPYFIQLSNQAVKELFGVDVKISLFDENIPSLGVKGHNTPAYLCGAGLERMAKEFKRFPKQYEVNLNALKAVNDDYLTGVSLLEKLYNGL